MKEMNKLLRIVGVIFILIAIYFLAKPHIDNYLTKKADEDKITEYEKKQQFSGEIPKDKSKMVGYIEVPDAKIKAPVFPGPATPKQLDRGISLVEADESLNDQNIAIAGHTFEGSDTYQFSNLPKAHKGSVVNFKVGKDKRKYKISKIYDVKPSDVKVLDEQQSKQHQLTLITCDDYNKKTGQWEKRKIFIAKAV
ncbi:class A sortase SrtA [Staphylococcus gallinarum]|uniref:class A sortase SrtA n=1 Tax=Staphylococcus gallinarum TaxID=1293 RepID=UPI001E5EFDC5|nr:class A sortase SrtA [Staphylococcus gallinarum]MCD8903483.1 class A sortase SrtA [Staphylococcus gallinarum]